MHVLLDAIWTRDIRRSIRIEAVQQCDVRQVLSLASGNSTAVTRW